MVQRWSTTLGHGHPHSSNPKPPPTTLCMRHRVWHMVHAASLLQSPRRRSTPQDQVSTLPPSNHHSQVRVQQSQTGTHRPRPPTCMPDLAARAGPVRPHACQTRRCAQASSTTFPTRAASRRGFSHPSQTPTPTAPARCRRCFCSPTTSSPRHCQRRLLQCFSPSERRSPRRVSWRWTPSVLCAAA